ncbi:MAG: HEAT repeat domain-containing protein, partial [Gemmataceae bacterium]|nr:HEAT repeat domain-containing protein [Gemmataceae bacterium]
MWCDLRMAFCASLLALMATLPMPPMTGGTATAEAELTKLLGDAGSDKLIDYLRQQILTEPVQRRIEELIRQLGDPTFRARQAAQRQLIEIGPVALPQLRRATTHPDQEVAGRARRCIQELRQGPRANLTIWAIDMLVARQEPRLLPLLFDLIPATDDDPLASVIADSLVKLAEKQPAHRQTIREALDLPRSRPTALRVLLRLNDPDLQQQLPRFLEDPDPAVRFHAGMTLLRQGDRKAIPALISVIGDSSSVLMWQQVEEELYSLAGELAPAVPVKSSQSEGRQAIAQQWSEWWKVKGDQILLGGKDDYPTEVCVVAETGITNRVYEWRPNGKPRFEIKDLVSPVDARVLPGKRVLIAEQAGRRVSERSFSGQVIWEKVFDDEPVSVMRLPNGNTFVAMMQRVVEVRRDGEIVVSISLPDPNLSISDANRLSDGRIGIITTE